MRGNNYKDNVCKLERRDGCQQRHLYLTLKIVDTSVTWHNFSPKPEKEKIPPRKNFLNISEKKFFSYIFG